MKESRVPVRHLPPWLRSARYGVPCRASRAPPFPLGIGAFVALTRDSARKVEGSVRYAARNAREKLLRLENPTRDPTCSTGRSEVASNSLARSRRADLSRSMGVRPKAFAKREANAERLIPAMEASCSRDSGSEKRRRMACIARDNPGSARAAIHGSGGVPLSILRRSVKIKHCFRSASISGRVPNWGRADSARSTMKCSRKPWEPSKCSTSTSARSAKRPGTPIPSKRTSPHAVTTPHAPSPA